MQAVIVVGDVDVNQIEEKIKTIFSDVPAPATPTEKPIYPVAENAEPVFGILTDPELTSSQIELHWRRQPMLPIALNNTALSYQLEMASMFL